jgi:hemolysin activation/secretion protein
MTTAVVTAKAYAQAIPPGVLPGAVQRESAREPQPVRRDGLIQIDRSRFAEQAPSGADQVKVTLNSVTLQGTTVFKYAELEALWATDLGREITLSDVFAIAGRISAYYRNRGYVLSQAVIPQQDLNDKAADLRIEVLEGYIDKITVSGVDSPLLNATLAPIRAERPLTLATLERSLLLINELAGVSAQASLRAGSTPNASDLELVVTHDPRQFSLVMDNRINPAFGDVQLDATAEFNGVLGDFDRHSLRLISSANKRLYMLSYGGEYPLSADGLKAQFAASVSRSEPAVELANIDSRYNNLSLGLTYPVLRSRQTNLGVRAALTGTNSSSDIESTRATDEKIRAVRVGFAADYADSVGGISLLDVEFAKGLSGLGASSEAELFGAIPTFSKTTVYAARLQSLGGDWSLLAAVTAQSSPDKLTTGEQMGLGGALFLRAYDPSEVIGENGVAGKIELRFNTWMAGIASTFYAYFDSGRVRQKQLAAGETSTSLESTGLGVRFSGPARTKGFIEVAKPGSRPVTSQGNNDARVFAGLGIDF